MHEIKEYYAAAILRDCRAKTLENEGCYVTKSSVSNTHETLYVVKATHTDLILEI